MLKRIPPDHDYYPSEESYQSLKEWYKKQYTEMSHNSEPCKCVSCTIHMFLVDEFDEEGMERLIILIAGMEWLIEKNALTDDDPHDVAYNTWLAIKDYEAGDFDDLWTPEDAIQVRDDIEKLNAYFDAHPLLKVD